MLTDFIGDLFVAQIGLHLDTLVPKCIDRLLHVIGLLVRDAAHHHLHRREPGRQRAGVLLDQDADEALQAADDGAVEHDRRVALARFGHVLGAQALRHREVDLHRAALPLAAQRILEGVLDLRAVESAVARCDDHFHPGSLQAGDQRGLGLVPDLV